MQPLSRDESLRLLASMPVGRLVFTVRDRPQVRPVNFVVDGTDVILRTAEGSKLAAAVRNIIVAFEADEIDIQRHAGWTVTVTGRVSEIRDPVEMERLRGLLTPWAPGRKEHFLKITPDLVYGARLSPDAILAPS